MDWKRDLIDVRCKSDSVHFEADAMIEGNLHAVHWDDLLVDATTLTHLRKTARGYVELNLGYLPPDDTMLPYEPYLRALVQMYWQNAINEEEFWRQTEDHLKLIRKADMQYNTVPSYDDAIYRNYKETFVPYGYAVRERLTKFLGYEPQLQHSLIAEMWMRDIMADDIYKMPDGITPDDVRAITLIKYREVLLSEGLEAADKSELWGGMTNE